MEEVIMKTVKLSLREIIAILDPMQRDAYDKLQRALEKKAMAEIGEENWLKVWNSDEWQVNMELIFDDEVAYEN
jgi:hypothetical protein